MDQIRSHEDLIVWQKAMELAVTVYAAATKLPHEEMYGLRSQMTRAAVSIPANIAEGHGRGTAKSYANFLMIARGSLMELLTFMKLAQRLQYLTAQEAQPIHALGDEISRMLATLKRNILKPKSG